MGIAGPAHWDEDEEEEKRFETKSDVFLQKQRKSRDIRWWMLDWISPINWIWNLIYFSFECGASGSAYDN